jgi:mono/diheme cytochrome c family protein
VTHEPRWYRSPSVLFAAGALVVIVVFQLVLGRGSSGSPSEFTLFLGRFHPLVVHLPIGVLVLVGLGEVATFFPRYRSRIDPALGLVLPVLLVVTVTAFVLGHFLGRSGGYAARALSTHQKLELLAAVSACISVALWTRQAALETPSARNVYRGSLFLTLTLLSVGAHFGGTLTHGDSYLTEYAPGPFRRLLGGKARPAASGSAKAPKPKATAEPLVYADVVAPILAKYCVDCHGTKKQKGKLRLDSLEAMLKGGEDGPAFVAGSSATSDLVKRIRLPKDDDDRMPPEGKPGPTPDELAVIAFFIDRGASRTLRVKDTLAPASGRKVLEAALAGTPKLPGAVASSSAPTREANEPPSSAPSAEPAKSAPDEAPSKSAPKTESDHAEKAPPPNEPPATKPTPTGVSTAGSPGGRAVLADKCEKCHGPSKKKGGLRVDSVALLLAGGEDGPVVVPGDPEHSELIRRVRLPVSQKEHMPPKKEPQLGEAEVSALVAWVRSLSKKSAESERATPSDVAAKADSSASSRVESASSESPESPPSPASAEPAEKSASTPPETTTAAAADTPPNEALLARVPARIAVYEEAVAPLLSKRCSKCHAGPKPAAKLRVNDYAALVEGGLSGPGIVPGKPDESFVCQRISLPPKDDDHMPPVDEPPMTADEIALVRFWVERGASASDSLPAKEFPPPALRAAAEYAGASGNKAALHAGAGCAACNVGKSSSSSRNAFALAGLALGAFFLRRARRGAPLARN